MDLLLRRTHGPEARVTIIQVESTHYVSLIVFPVFAAS